MHRFHGIKSAAIAHMLSHCINHESRFLHHYGGAVFFFARRQCTPDRLHCAIGNNAGAGVDDADAQAFFRALLRGTGWFCRRFR